MARRGGEGGRCSTRPNDPSAVVKPTERQEERTQLCSRECARGRSSSRRSGHRRRSCVITHTCALQCKERLPLQRAAPAPTCAE